jgi:uncharacterized membrane protein
VHRVTESGGGEAPGLTLGLTPSHAALVAWAGAWVSGAALLAVDARDPFVRSHAAHAVAVCGGLMALAIGLWGLAILSAFVSPGLFRALAWLSTTAWVVFVLGWIYGVVQAIRRVPVKLPVFTKLARRLASFP